MHSIVIHTQNTHACIVTAVGSCVLLSVILTHDTHHVIQLSESHAKCVRVDGFASLESEKALGQVTPMLRKSLMLQMRTFVESQPQT